MRVATFRRSKLYVQLFRIPAFTKTHSSEMPTTGSNQTHGFPLRDLDLVYRLKLIAVLSQFGVQPIQQQHPLLSTPFPRLA